MNRLSLLGLDDLEKNPEARVGNLLDKVEEVVDALQQKEGDNADNPTPAWDRIKAVFKAHVADIGGGNVGT